MGRRSGVALPLVNELHGKVTFEDHLGVLPRELPLMIWSDPLDLVWSDEERATARAAGALLVRIGPNTLRTETAAIALVTLARSVT